MSSSSSEEKRNHLDQMLNTGKGLVMVHLDPRPDHVKVPPQFKGDAVLRLNIAYGFNLPHLDLDETGVYAMLSFGGRRFGCNLPWDAIFALTMPSEDHQGVVWPEDLPPELRPFFTSPGFEGRGREAALQAVSLAGVLPAAEAPKPPQRVKLAVVAAVAETEPEPEPEPEPTPSEASVDEEPDAAPAVVKPARPALRLVK